MIDRLRKNYSLTMSLVSVLFAVSVAFCGFFTAESLLIRLNGIGLVLPKSFFLTAVVALAGGAICVGLVWGVVNLFFRFAKIFNLPLNEIVLLSMLFVGGRNIVLGCLNILFRLVPVTYTWGHLIAYCLLTLICAFLFFKTIDKLYLSAKAAPFLFKSFCIFVVICVGIGLVLRFNGGVL